MIILLLAKALNLHQSTESDGEILSDQKKIAQIAEMIHVASLMHDDVIDASETRRGKSSVHFKWGQLNAILVGDFILSKASKALAKLKNIEVIVVLAQVIEDLVKGEFMQLGSKEDEDQRFAHYLQKTYKKTASLIANSCKAVAILSGADEEDSQLAYLYGRHVGIAFQLIDDLLDFISNTELMGKPTAADLKLGLATGPVLFAAQKFPDLNTLIMRRFKEEGDVDQAWNYVKQSDGIQQTRLLAENHCCQAINQIKQLKPSMAREALISITHMVLDRKK
ncbi:all trans-polyprenyl-diphosphate synthase PDSS1-like isoform X2 [Tubulanus polymorphus]